MPLFNEQEIISGCKSHNRVYQEFVYKKYYSLFLKICMRYTKDLQDAEQLLQDGFLKIFKSIEGYLGNGSFEGWMKRIVINSCLDFVKSKYQKDLKQVMYPEKMSDTLATVSENTALERIAMKDLLILIQSLPPMSRTVFNLYVFEGYSHREISDMLNISEGTSQWHVNNARKSLKEKLKKNNGAVTSYHETGL